MHNFLIFGLRSLLFRLLREKVSTGWLAWPEEVDAYLLPPAEKSALLPWDSSNKDALEAIREVATQESFWQKLSKHYSSENHSDVIIQDNAS